MTPPHGREEIAQGLPRADRFGLVLGIGATLLLVVLLGRVAQLQIAPGEQLQEHVQQRQSGRRVEAPRGAIIDQQGRILATSRWVYRVVLDPTLLPRGEEGELDAAIVTLAREIDMAPEAIGQAVFEKLLENQERAATRKALGLDQPSDAEEDPVALLARKIGLGTGPDEENAGSPQPKAPRLHQYLPLEPLLEGPHAERIAALKIPGVSLERREHRDYPGGDLVASIVGKTGMDPLAQAEDGWLGAERRFDNRLGGDDGEIRYARDAWGRPLWVDRGGWVDAEPGEPLRLSIDLELQRIAVEELTKGMEAANAAGGRLVMVDPATGEVLAMADLYREVPEAQPFPFVIKDEETGEWNKPWGELAMDPRDRPRFSVLRADPGRSLHPALGRNRCVEDVYEPGSTFKPFIWAEGKRLGLLPDDEVLHQEVNYYLTPYGRPLQDVTFRQELNWDEVLKFSSNIGMSQITDRMSHTQAQDIIRRMGFGRKTDLGLPGETRGIVTSRSDWTKWTQTSVSMGYEVAVTPVQMVRAFSALARGGELKGSLPELRLTAAGLDERPGLTGNAQIIRRVIEPEIVDRIRPALEGVVERMDLNRVANMPEQAPATYNLFGKSGTANIPCSPPPGYRRPRAASGYYVNQYNSSFIAAGPTRDPRLVVLVVIDDPGPRKVRLKQHYGSWVAGPVVRGVMERSLRYLGVQPDVVREDTLASAE